MLDTVTEKTCREVPFGYDRAMTIRVGTAADAASLAALARDTFFDTFASTNDAADMALHLERAYGVPQQTAELTDPSHHDAAGGGGRRRRWRMRSCAPATFRNA